MSKINKLPKRQRRVVPMTVGNNKVVPMTVGGEKVVPLTVGDDRVVPLTTGDDFLDELVNERTEKNPDFSKLVREAEERRKQGKW